MNSYFLTYKVTKKNANMQVSELGRIARRLLLFAGLSADDADGGYGADYGQERSFQSHHYGLDASVAFRSIFVRVN